MSEHRSSVDASQTRGERRVGISGLRVPLLGDERLLLDLFLELPDLLCRDRVLTVDIHAIGDEGDSCDDEKISDRLVNFGWCHV